MLFFQFCHDSFYEIWQDINFSESHFFNRSFIQKTFILGQFHASTT